MEILRPRYTCIKGGKTRGSEAVFTFCCHGAANQLCMWVQESFFEAIYMQISIPDGKCWNDFAINKKHIILLDPLQALLLRITCVCGYVLEISGVVERTGENNFHMCNN